MPIPILYRLSMSYNYKREFLAVVYPYYRHHRSNSVYYGSSTIRSDDLGETEKYTRHSMCLTRLNMVIWSVIYAMNLLRKGILKFLRISRDDAKDVTACWDIYEAGSNKLVYSRDYLAKLKIQSDDTRERILLPESFGFAGFAVVVVNKVLKNVNVFDDSNNPNMALHYLSPNRYLTRIVIRTGLQELLVKGEFVVQTEYPFAYWVKAS